MEYMDTTTPDEDFEALDDGVEVYEDAATYDKDEDERVQRDIYNLTYDIRSEATREALSRW